jgi:hypothetical protein
MAALLCMVLGFVLPHFGYTVTTPMFWAIMLPSAIVTTWLFRAARMMSDLMHRKLDELRSAMNENFGCL